MSIGKRLLQLRLEKKLTQQEVADHLHIARQTISKWENDQTLPSLETLQTLCQLYGVSVATLMEEKEINQSLIPSTYLEIQKTLEKLQRQHKKKQYMSYLLMILCIVLLSSSIYTHQQLKVYQDYINKVDQVSTYQDESFEKYFMESDMLTPISYIKVKQMNLNEKSVQLEGKFVLKEYTQQMVGELVFNQGLPIEKSYMLEKENDNTFIFSEELPLQNYRGVCLRFNDGQGKVVLEKLSENYTDLFSFLTTIHEKTTSIYMPMIGGKLQLDTLIYEPTKQFVIEDFIIGDLWMEGSVDLRVYNSTTKKTLYDDSFPISDKFEIKLSTPIKVGDRISVEVYIQADDQLDSYYMAATLKTILDNRARIDFFPL